VHARRKADDQQAGRGVAEGGYRAGVIIGVPDAYLVEKSSEAWAGAAIGVEVHR
jgi:hypothetical protein